ncbi:unnamed protein product [Rhizoctonia solani]|uniref:ribonuclease H n=1 Tax=Rhizoctonia solani TaxID=456999 RepID=A0A8H3H851_9AGAM|nr:unnamed protein product [Rhizoctonia solani]CAE6516046.1 unnamed protein product [Rhizoctonia solani]
MHNGDYPGQAFFGVHRGRKQCVEPTYDKLLKNIQDFPGAIYEVFMNRAHAAHFSKTGQVPVGAVPVKPGASRTMVSPGVSRTLGAPSGSGSGLAPLEVKNKAALTNTAAIESKPTSTALAKSAGSGASGSKSGGLNVTATLRASGLSTGNKSTSINTNTTRNASTSATTHTREIQVWTDGSCLGNGKQGAKAAYAVYFGPNDPRNEARRVPGSQTNNMGEIFAVIRALEIVDEGVKQLTIYTDSKYTIECLGWLPGWRRRGGMNSSNKPAAHYEMVKYMDALIQRRGGRFKLVHVYGHQDNVGNNAADLLARAAADGEDFPPNRDWKLECVKLEKKPLVPVTGSPKITAVDSVTIKKEPDEDSDYGYSDIELDGADLDNIDSPLGRHPSDGTRDTSVSADDRPAAGKKRARGEPTEEAVDSDAERKSTKKKAKEQAVKCPNCKHKFNVTLRK